MGLKLSIDLKGIQSLERRMHELDGVEVETGFFEESRYTTDNGGRYVATVAAYNNFGTQSNPERPFMDDTFQSGFNQVFMAKSMIKVFKGALTSKPDTLLANLGELVKDIMIKEIDDYPGSNSPATIARKGFNDPLLDSGVMIDSVKYKINR